MLENIRFVSPRDIIELKRKELFEILSNNSKSNFFISKCEEFGEEVVLYARDQRDGYGGRTLLHTCVSHGGIKEAAYLISLGHEVNVVDSCLSKVTPLMEAVLRNNIQIVKLLIENGADIFQTDAVEDNSMHYAARIGSTKMISVLIKISHLNSSVLQRGLSNLNLKKKLPENVASNEFCREVLYDFRTKGFHLSLRQIRERKNNQPALTDMEETLRLLRQTLQLSTKHSTEGNRNNVVFSPLNTLKSSDRTPSKRDMLVKTPSSFFK